MTMSESPYTGYVEKWTARFARLMQAQARADTAEKAYRAAIDERNRALGELSNVQTEITVALKEELTQAPAETPWGKTKMLDDFHG